MIVFHLYIYIFTYLVTYLFIYLFIYPIIQCFFFFFFVNILFFSLYYYHYCYYTRPEFRSSCQILASYHVLAVDMAPLLLGTKRVSF